METSQEFLNVSQLLINTLTEGANINRHYLFQPEEASQIIRLLDLFCDVKRRYIKVSFYYNPVKDKTLSLKVHDKPFGSSVGLINYLSEEEKKLTDSYKITKTPQGLRKLIVLNFL